MTNYVPYQLCPKCNGEGRIYSPLIINPSRICPVCDGEKIIPMHQIEIVENRMPEGAMSTEDVYKTLTESEEKKRYFIVSFMYHQEEKITRFYGYISTVYPTIETLHERIKNTIRFVFIKVLSISELSKLDYCRFSNAADGKPISDICITP